MKSIVCTLRAFTIAATFIASSAALTAQAGETSVYLKSGYFTWSEKLNGSPFVKETGFLHAAGVTREDDLSALTIAETLELWGGNLDYDGHDLTGATQLKSDTSYLGTKEEIVVGVKLATCPRLTLMPFAALGHKFWIRTRSSEDWNSFYGKAGVRGEMKTGFGALFVKAGALAPLYTRNHVSLSSGGYTDVVTEPKSEISAFGEAGVKLGAWAVSMEYEGMRFGQSAKVSTNRITNAQNGVVIQNNLAYQPDSQSDLFSLKVAYSF
jgi:hypothetical protein